MSAGALSLSSRARLILLLVRSGGRRITRLGGGRAGIGVIMGELRTFEGGQKEENGEKGGLVDGLVDGLQGYGIEEETAASLYTFQF